MKRIAMSLAAVVLLASFSIPVFAQEEKTKEKTKDDKKDVEQIIITRKGGADEKIVVEVNGDKVTVNGKPVEDLKDGDVKVRRNKYKSYDAMDALGAYNFNWNDNEPFKFYGDVDENTAMLGVTTEKVEEGAKINNITDESAAEKAGLKKDDIITKIDDKKIGDPDALSEAIRKHKPGEKVTITYLRDKKEHKVTAELGKWKGNAFTIAPKMPDMKILQEGLPRIRTPYGQSWAWSGGAPKLGLSVQDTDDGKGVKVIEVDDESNAAKAGVKENDIITHVNDKEVNSADEIAKIVRENKEKISIRLQVKREGKSQNIEVKMPRKLKTADL